MAIWWGSWGDDAENKLNVDGFSGRNLSLPPLTPPPLTRDRFEPGTFLSLMPLTTNWTRIDLGTLFSTVSMQQL
jgi:hypothetical protein